MPGQMSLLKRSAAARALALTTTTLLMISSTATAQQQNQTCYFPDGSESGHLACSSSGTQAACCGDSQVCMDNGLCFGDGIMSRGSCTDQDWNSKECSQYCGEGMCFQYGYQRQENAFTDARYSKSPPTPASPSWHAQTTEKKANSCVA